MTGLWPREHGVYAQLAFPLATGLTYSRGHPGALAFIVAAASLFFAHEPLAVLMGTRGVRLRDLLVQAARRRLWMLAGVAGVALVAAAALAPARAWQAAVIPALLSLALVPLFFTNRIKTLGGELVVAAVCSTAVLPLALSGSDVWAGAWTATAVWFGAFAPSILSVHAVKVSHKGRARARWLVPVAPLTALVVGGVAVGAVVASPQVPRAALAILPPVLAVLGIAALRPHPRHLKRIGWTMVAAYAATLVLLLVR